MAEPKINLEEITLDSVFAGDTPITTDDDKSKGDNPKGDEKTAAELEAEEAARIAAEEAAKNAGDDKSKGKDDPKPDDAGDGDGEEGEGPTSIVQEISASLGIEVDGEFEDTPEGLVEFTRQAAETLADERLAGIFERHPSIKSHMDFVLAGGDPEKYFEATQKFVDVASITIDENNVEAQKQVLTTFFKKKGHDDAFIKETIEDYEDSKKLFVKAQAVQPQLVELQKKEKDALIAGQLAASKAAEDAAQEFWNEVSTTLEKKNDLAGITIPVKDKASFFDYISKPVDKSGTTKRQQDYEKASLDVKLAMDYLLYKGFKINDIIQVKAKTESAKTLRERLKSGEGALKGKSGDKGPVAANLDNIEFNSFGL